MHFRYFIHDCNDYILLVFIVSARLDPSVNLGDPYMIWILLS